MQESQPYFISFIVVTYNSEKFIKQCFAPFIGSDVAEVVVVDNHSVHLKYLKEYSEQDNFKLIQLEENVGFGRANNIGLKAVSDRSSHVVFLNHDVFLPEGWLEKLIKELDRNSTFGIMSGPLFGYNHEQGRPTNVYDSLGIEQKIYGKWYDRCQGEEVKADLSDVIRPKAICGALMIIRLDLIRANGLYHEIFDPNYFMYKEDIDLSIRIKRMGYDLIIIRELWAYHCRGWKKDRKSIDKKWKIMSAKNELYMNKKYRSIYSIYSLIKLLYVWLLER